MASHNTAAQSCARTGVNRQAGRGKRTNLSRTRHQAPPSTPAPPRRTALVQMVQRAGRAMAGDDGRRRCAFPPDQERRRPRHGLGRLLAQRAAPRRLGHDHQAADGGAPLRPVRAPPGRQLLGTRLPARLSFRVAATCPRRGHMAESRRRPRRPRRHLPTGGRHDDTDPEWDSTICCGKRPGFRELGRSRRTPDCR